MNVLIVYAHPEPKSFNGAMRDLAVIVLEAQGHAVQVSDLYGMNFNPVPGRGDFLEVADPDCFRYQTEQRHAFEQQSFAPDLVAEQEKLVWADLVIFQFPLWWFSLPAILKGWVDRVFAVGFAYGGGKVYDQGVFQGKKAMIALTTGAPAIAFTPTGTNRVSFSQLLFHIHSGMFYFVGMEVLPPFVAWSPARVEPGVRSQYLEQYRQRLLTLETTPAIAVDRLLDDRAVSPPAAMSALPIEATGG